jgi:hypothetical protein
MTARDGNSDGERRDGTWEKGEKAHTQAVETPAPTKPPKA